mmetsp:Transcript_38833/g.77007  ORF Transcript_38833/g.77007 Transcript_38833/m.77007 type:complete len:91 (-) Transcript_38833:13-285(-)
MHTPTSGKMFLAMQEAALLERTAAALQLAGLTHEALSGTVKSCVVMNHRGKSMTNSLLLCKRRRQWARGSVEAFAAIGGALLQRTVGACY